MSTIPIFADENWRLPSRGRVGMFSLIIGESAIFTIFVVAYIYYIGRSAYGPTPQILDIPVFNTICLLSSSLTIWMAEHAIERGKIRVFGAWWALTMTLGIVFLAGTALEWNRLIFTNGLTIRTNLFGTTFYSLVGLHATHVIVGLIMLSLVMLFTLSRPCGAAPCRTHPDTLALLALCRCGVGSGLHSCLHRGEVS